MMRRATSAALLALCADLCLGIFPAEAQVRYFVYEVALSDPTAEVELLDCHDLYPVESPPWGSRARVVGTSETEGLLAELGLAVVGKSGSVPFRWLRPNELGVAVSPEAPPPRLSARDGYRDRRAVESLLVAWARHYPERCALYRIGVGARGAPILAMRISNRPREDADKPAVLFGGALHANELFTVEVVLDLMEHLILDYPNDERARRWVDECEIWAIPILNPDGHDCVFDLDHRWRKNARETFGDSGLSLGDGVDLNRNFPTGWSIAARTSADPVSGNYRGPAPGSEPETAALMALAERERFALIYTYHTAGGWVIYPYSERSLRPPTPNYAEEFAEALGARLTVEDSTRPYRVATEMYPVSGVDQDHYYFAFGSLAYIIEVGRKGGQPELVRWREPLLERIRPSWEFALDALTRGPRVSGHVRDASTGRPLAAEVRIAEQRLHMGETWTAHPVTGRFDRLFASPRSVTLVAQMEGYRTEAQTVAIPDGPVHVELRLSPLDEAGELPAQ